MISWLDYGTKGDHSIQAEGNSQDEAYRKAEAMGLVQRVIDED